MLMPEPRRHAHYTKMSWAVESVRRLNYTPRSNYHYPFKHVKCVLLRCPCSHRMFDGGMGGCFFFRFPISAAVQWILRCMHALFLPITTMRYMSWLGGNVFLRTETATSHVFAQMHDEKWHMQRHAARKTRSPWRCQQMNHFFFSLFLGEGPKQWARMEKMKWNGERRETCVMSAINLNLPFTRLMCVWANCLH